MNQSDNFIALDGVAASRTEYCLFVFFTSDRMFLHLCYYCAISVALPVGDTELKPAGIN